MSNFVSRIASQTPPPVPPTLVPTPDFVPQPPPIDLFVVPAPPLPIPQPISAPPQADPFTNYNPSYPQAPNYYSYPTPTPQPPYPQTPNYYSYPTPTPQPPYPQTPNHYGYTTPTPAPQPVYSDPLTGMSPEELRVVELTNNIRQQNGLPPLTPNPQLAFAADTHSQNMAFQDFFSHTGLDGSQPWDRTARAGYYGSTVGENIGAGYSTPDAAVQGWLTSPGHLANILNPAFTQIGVGYQYSANDTGATNYNDYWTQVFGG